MKNYKKSFKYFVIGIICLIFLPIIIIHILFSYYPDNEWLVAKWSAGELLGYFGAIIGSLTTIAALVTTILYNSHENREKNRLSVLPYLQSEYKPLYKYEEIFKEQSLGYMYIIFDEKIASSNEPLWEFKNMTPEEFYKNKLLYLQSNYIIEYKLENVGANSAANIRWTLNGEPILPDFSLSKDTTKKFIIFIRSSLLENHNTKILNLKFIYNDVLSIGEYMQKENIKFKKDEFGLTSSQSLADLITKPELVI